MSRIGKLAIQIPDSVKITQAGVVLTISGPKGNLEISLPLHSQIKMENNQIFVTVDDSLYHPIQGLTRTLIHNAVIGVTESWNKNLELSGTGFRASTTGSELQLSLGFSHPVVVKAPPGVKFEVKENKISVNGPDKYQVGQTAAKIRNLKKADPYKAKGFKYEGEVIIKKAGKAAKTTA